MKAKQTNIKDNRGSTLILVMIAISFISIIGVTILSLSATNYKMKVVDRSAKNNFYEAEAILDQIKTGLETVSSKKAELAYQEFLANYGNFFTDAQRKDQFSYNYRFGVGTETGMIRALGGDPAAVEVDVDTGMILTSYDVDIIKNYLKPADQAALITAAAAENQMLFNEQRIILKNVKITYSSMEYGTNLSTDIVLDVPDFTYNTTVVGGGPEFGKYSLIADYKLVVGNGTNNATFGSVYAGDGGIEVQSGTPSDPVNYVLVGDRIITKGDVRVVNSGKLRIGVDHSVAAEKLGGLSPAFNQRPDVWARNVVTERITNLTANQAGLKITGNCYVANDLKINAPNSVVEFGNGSTYYGYGYNSINMPGGSVNSQYSSAIFINGSGSSLNMKRIRELELAGRAFVSKKSDVVGGPAVDVLMGESLTVKQNQLAYLVPGKYIHEDVGTNPMLKVDFDAKTNFNTNVNDILKTDLLEADGIKQYLNESKMIDLIFPNPMIGMESMAYCYYNFKNQQAANEYMEHYYSDPVNRAELEENMDYFLAAQGIQLNDASRMAMRTMGNLVTYSSASGSSIIRNTVDPDEVGGVDLTREKGYMDTYNCLLMNLTPGGGIGMSPTSVFENLVDVSILNSLVAPGTVYEEKINLEGTEYGVYVANTSFTVQPSTLDGIIVATGDVTVNGGFKGVIISGGTVSISMGSITTESDPQLVQNLLNYDAKDTNPMAGLVPNIKVAAIFKDFTSSGTTVTTGNGSINVSKWISYENWKKN